MVGVRFSGMGVLAATLMLAACSPAPEDAPQAVEGVPGMEVTNARMVLPPVKGNPAAVYFDLTYEGERPLSISRAHVEGAESAVLHTYGEWNRKIQMMDALDIPITKGTRVEFKPGDLHVMAMNVAPELEAGDITEVTVIVSGGDKYSFDAEVRAPGDDR